jgi:hypothetical protein
MDENLYEAPQTERKRPLGKMATAQSTGTIVGVVIGGLLVPVWSLVAAVYHGSWIVVAPEPTDFVLVLAVIALAGASIGRSFNLFDLNNRARTMHFTVTCIGSDPLGLLEMLERFANEQWLPAHVTRDEAAVIALDQFERTIYVRATDIIEIHAFADSKLGNRALAHVLFHRPLLDAR